MKSTMKEEKETFSDKSIYIESKNGMYVNVKINYIFVCSDNVIVIQKETTHLDFNIKVQLLQLYWKIS